jgi:hypothetical protein
MNVVTSLLGLVIVSHLSPKGSGRFTGPPPSLSSPPRHDRADHFLRWWRRTPFNHLRTFPANCPGAPASLIKPTRCSFISPASPNRMVDTSTREKARAKCWVGCRCWPRPRLVSGSPWCAAVLRVLVGGSPVDRLGEIDPVAAGICHRAHWSVVVSLAPIQPPRSVSPRFFTLAVFPFLAIVASSLIVGELGTNLAFVRGMSFGHRPYRGRGCPTVWRSAKSFPMCSSLG